MTEVATPRDIVRDIVEARIGRSTMRPYQGAVDAVVTAFEQRDQAIADALLEKVHEDAGIRNIEDYQMFVREVGLVRQPERDSEGEVNGPVTDGFDADRLAATLHRIDTRLESLEAIARRAGMMGRPVAD